MYHPKFDGPLLLHDDMGTYDRVRYHPRIHQQIISKLDFGLRLLYQREKTIKLEPLPETMVDPSQASATPDIVLIDPSTELVRIIIEVCHSASLKQDIQKVVDLLDNERYDIQEGFIYNYKTQIWYRYRAGNGGLVDESSFSDELCLDLNQFLLTD